jgi:hypothetical protein
VDRFRRRRLVVIAAPALAGVLALALGLVAPGAAGAQEEGWSATVYLQEAFPKQTRTNAQIEQINQTFGSRFETWDDVHNISLGAKVFRRAATRWWVGIEGDWSAGSISGNARVDTPAGPATLKFEQRYSVYADLMAAAHFLPCPDCRRFEPFVLMGAGVAYEKDRTTLTLRNELLDEGLFVDNDGWFPVATAGVGAQVLLSDRHHLALEVGVAYFWGRLEHQVAANGSLAPAPQVTADTDSTGPNYWLGIAWRFGARR